MKIARIVGWVAFGICMFFSLLLLLDGRQHISIMFAVTCVLMYYVCMIPYYVVKGFVGNRKMGEVVTPPPPIVTPPPPK